MKIRYVFVLAGCLLAGGCATGGQGVGFDAGNSRSQCTSQMARSQIPPGQLHDYMQHCMAGNDADDDSSDKGFHIGASGGSR